MAAGAIRLFPDAVLRQKAKPVSDFDRRLKDLVGTLDRVMRAQPHGIGIAAPQIGVSRRVAVVDVSDRVPECVRLVLVNPVILEGNSPRSSREGCMSMPDYSGNLLRYDRILLRWADENGVFHERRATGIEAVCIQHEIDHLDGILFFDRIACLKTDMVPRTQKTESRRQEAESRRQKAGGRKADS